MTAHTAIRPSIEQLFAEWKQQQSFGNTRLALQGAESDIKKRTRLWAQFLEVQDEQERIRAQVLAQIDATFGPGMGEAVKEMIGDS